jgi:hypothetical protein
VGAHHDRAAEDSARDAVGRDEPVSDESADDGLYVIRSFSNDMEASLAEAVLEANGIPSTRISDDAAGMMPWLHSLHPIRLMVRREDVEIAVALLDGGSPTEPPPD